MKELRKIIKEMFDYKGYVFDIVDEAYIYDWSLNDMRDFLEDLHEQLNHWIEALKKVDSVINKDDFDER